MQKIKDENIMLIKAATWGIVFPTIVGLIANSLNQNGYLWFLGTIIFFGTLYDLVLKKENYFAQAALIGIVLMTILWIMFHIVMPDIHQDITIYQDGYQYVIKAIK